MSALVPFPTQVVSLRHARSGFEAIPKGRQAGPEALREATRRYRLIEPYLNGSRRPDQPLPARTRQRWMLKFRTAQATHGVGFLGLLPGARGNPKPRLHEATRDLMNKFIEESYETLKQKGKFAVYGQYVMECERQCIQAASYKTFATEISRRPKFEQTLKREGARAAYAHEPFYYQLSPTIPRHGDRPFEIAHIDHTELDVELICVEPHRNLGRPWATFLTDAFSRRLLAVLLLYDPPSYRSNMMILRECVRRHHRFPHTIVVDGGKDFHSLYFDSLLAAQECAKRVRPGGKSRFGSVIERLFGVSDQQFVHNLQGNTQITKKVRQVTKSVAPATQAIWTLPLLYERLCEWAYEVYDTSFHGRLEQSPRAAFESGMQMAGDRLHRMIRYDEAFRLLTLPTTRRGAARVIPNNGVKINNRYYWANAFRNAELGHTSVPVRYDPYDAGQAYAFVKGIWVRCHSEHYHVFQGRTEREIKLASSELRKRQSRGGALRGSLEDSLKRRRPAAFFIDEAHHLGKVSGGRKFQDHLDVIKSLANTAETLHVLVGTYELQLLLNLSDQLSRRSRTFHFERYRSGQTADVKAFQNIIWNFQQRLPFSEHLDLREHSQYLMERSLGCVGILKGWFVRAADVALDRGAVTLTIDHLKQHEPADAEWRCIATTLLEGEEALRESEAEIESLRFRLQQNVLATKANRHKKTPAVANRALESNGRPKRHPGERRPRRDPVGKKVNAADRE